MLIGNKNTFAIEWQITTAYSNPSLLGLGFYSVFVGNRLFGIQGDEATLLACSYDAVLTRIRNRGKHRDDRLDAESPQKILGGYCCAMFGDSDAYDRISDMSAEDFTAAINSTGILFAPDGDQAFDDGSIILHLDRVDSVILVAGKSTKACGVIDEGSVVQVSLEADYFYGCLAEWKMAVDKEMGSMAKC